MSVTTGTEGGTFDHGSVYFSCKAIVWLQNIAENLYGLVYSAFAFVFETKEKSAT